MTMYVTECHVTIAPMQLLIVIDTFEGDIGPLNL